MSRTTKAFLQAVADTPPPCTSRDPELFFPNYSNESLFAVKMAKKVCATCPLMNACFEFGLETEDGYAILGGTTPAERTAIKKRMDDPYLNTPGLRPVAA
jgi:WhiB family redox-sensing transcriptional regulator